MRRPGVRPAGVAATVLLTLAAAACSALPESGPVEMGEGPSASSSAAPFDFNPPGPVEGADRVQIVDGFLRALQATPVRTQVATEFLTAEAASAWRPDRRTIVYSGQRVVARRPDVVVHLDGTFELDRTGRWAGTGVSVAGRDRAAGAGEVADSALQFGFAKEDGEWRIADLPDAMIIPEAHFEARYREYFIPFFDATGSVLVPEQVYIPWGVTAPTLLVDALLAGPTGTGTAVERSYLPTGTRLDVSVPVRADGVAEVPLSHDMADLPKDQLDLAMAQLAWTLGQATEVKAFRVTVDGTPLEVPGRRDVVDVDAYQEYAPWVASASTDLYGIRGDSVVQVVGSSEIAAALLPDSLRRPRSLGVDLAGQQFALVPSEGDRVVVVPRSSGGTTGEAPRPAVAYRGTDLLRPMWDHTGRLWLVDRTDSGPVVVVDHFGRVRQLRVPALAGEHVLAAALSRDGTRLVAALDGSERSGDRLVMMRVVREASGQPVRLTQPREMSAPQPLLRVQDVGWRDPTTVAVLTRPSRTTSAVVLASADGSSGPISLDSALDVLFERGVSLAASPATPPALVVASRDGGVHALDVQGRWDLDAEPSGLRLPAYVG